MKKRGRKKRRKASKQRFPILSKTFTSLYKGLFLNFSLISLSTYTMMFFFLAHISFRNKIYVNILLPFRKPVPVLYLPLDRHRKTSVLAATFKHITQKSAVSLPFRTSVVHLP